MNGATATAYRNQEKRAEQNTANNLWTHGNGLLHTAALDAAELLDVGLGHWPGIANLVFGP
jgi:hypothetical protein